MGGVLPKLPAIIRKATNKVLPMKDGTLSRGLQGATFDDGTATWSGGSTSVITFRGIVNNDTGFFRRTDTERIGNLAVIVLADTVSSGAPKMGDRVAIDGEAGVVQRVYRDPALATYMLDCLS
jgi:hypothetical protein